MKQKTTLLPLKTTITACLMLSLAAPYAKGQSHHTVAGTVRDARSGETLIGASIVFGGQPQTGVVTNNYGFFSLTAPEGRYAVVVSFAGYYTDTLPVTLDADRQIKILLTPEGRDLQEVVIHPTSSGGNLGSPLMGVQHLSTKDIGNVPVMFGEKDILKTIQLLPGIQSSGDISNGFYVRGGGADENLILLDEAPVYNAYHLLGFFSTFNADAIKGVTIYKGGMPAQYGGRLSSVLDVTMNDGDNQQFHVSGGIGLIASRLNLEGPIRKNKGSFLISARRTYADLFLPLSKDSLIRNTRLYFYDINLKANYILNDRNTLYLSGYTGKDVLNLGNDMGVNWGNTTGTLRWNHLFSDRLFSNTSLIFSRYGYNVLLSSSNNTLSVTSKIEDFHLKEDFQWFSGPGQQVHFGIETIRHIISPGVISTDTSSSYNPLAIANKYSEESAVYVSHEWTPTSRWKMMYGLRFSAFQVLGPGTFYTYDSSGQAIDSSRYSSGQAVKSYYNLEPRFSMSYQTGPSSSVKVSYTRNVQNLHLLTNSTSNNPTDIWIPSSNNVQPGIADQVSLGYYRNFLENTYEWSTEVYYKVLQNQIDYKNGAQLEANVNVESQILFGKGRAYGMEWFLKKKQGRLTGWISYTLSRTERQFAAINAGSYFPANQDHTHDLSIVGMYKASRKWTLSSTFVYVSGSPVTWPIGKYEVARQIVVVYGPRNASRMPPYDRLDIGATLQGRTTARHSSSWTFSVFNVYARANPYTITFQTDHNDPSKTEAVQTSLFKVVPSVTYNFKF